MEIRKGRRWREIEREERQGCGRSRGGQREGGREKENRKGKTKCGEITRRRRTGFIFLGMPLTSFPLGLSICKSVICSYTEAALLQVAVHGNTVSITAMRMVTTTG